MKITDFLVMNALGEEIEADPQGNNVAFACPECGYLVLAIARDNQRGSDECHLADCRSCGTGYFLDVREKAKKLYVHDVRTDA